VVNQCREKEKKMKLFVWELPDGTFGNYIHAPTLAKARSGHDRWHHLSTGDRVSPAHRIREATPQETNARWAGSAETPEQYWAAQEAALEKEGTR
jgi:hypothetical protein